MTEIITLDKLKKGRPARIVTITCSDDGLEAKLREIGFAEGDEVELLTHGPRRHLAIHV